jgi:hypothetical protein
MQYNEALAVLSLARDNLLQIPLPYTDARETPEYDEAVLTIGAITELGTLAFHRALQRSGQPVTSYII